MVRIDFRSLLREETTLRWDFLENESDPCAVVTSRMELVYLNERCQTLVPSDWFAKRCFEVLPNTEALCAMDCPTIRAVQTSLEIAHSEERLELEDGTVVSLGTAVIPLRQSSDDGEKAVLLFRSRLPAADGAAFEAQLLSDAQALSTRVAAATP